MSNKSPSPDDSEGEKEKDTECPEGADGAEDIVGERESADGGSSPPDQQQPQGAEGGVPRETEDHASDLDKDIDAVLELNVKNGQINPDLSVTIDSIPVDSTLDSAKPELLEETDTDGMPTVQDDEQQLQAAAEARQIDENGNIEGAEKGSLEGEAGLKAKDVNSDKSFTSDTDSSVVAETLVKNALNVAMTAVKAEVSQDTEDPLNNKNQTAASGEASNNRQGDVKVGLFQYDFGDEDKVNSEDEYYDRSPDVSDGEDSTEDHIESMTEEDKQDIMKLYGLEGMEPVSPKSASPSGTGSSGFIPDEQQEARVIDVQRDVYEPLTKMFVVNREPSSSESTPRNGNSDMQNNIDMSEDRVPSQNSSEEKGDTENNDEDMVVSDTGIGPQDVEITQDLEQERRDDPVSLIIESRMNQDISPPLVRYEPVKENGKFRIIKTSKEGGGIRVGKDMSTPDQSPRSEGSQVSDISEPRTQDDQFPKEPYPTQDRQSIRSELPITASMPEREKQSQQPQPIREPIKSNERQDLYSSQGSQKSHDRQDLNNSQRSQHSEKSVSSSSDRNENKSRGQVPAKISKGTYDKLENNTSVSPRDLKMSELDAGQDGGPNRQGVSWSGQQGSQNGQEVDIERIRYTTRNTEGVETRRTGPVPFDVSYQQSSAHPANPYNKDR